MLYPFQSLIGQLQTGALSRYISKLYLFQSLIGQLQTLGNPSLLFIKGSFQSLIGQLQTVDVRYVELPNGLSFNPLQVSYKLPQPLYPSFYASLVSIPYRLATNDIGKPLQNLGNARFNPLQVSYKLYTKSRGQSKHIFVSIPYRLATNYGRRSKKHKRRNRFQSLIGQLQTRDIRISRATSIQFQSLIGQLQTKEGFNGCSY